MKIRTLKNIVTFNLLFAMAALVIAGGIETHGMTEMQALNDGFFYWLGSVACGLFMIIVQLIPTKRKNTFISRPGNESSF